MKQYLKLFKENYLLTKQEIIYSLDGFINHCKGSYLEEGWSTIRRDNIINLCYKFKSAIEKIKIPNLLDDWFFYDYYFDSVSMQLNLCYCEEIEFDEYGESSGMKFTEEFSIIKIKCDYVSLEEFAQMFKVKVDTVKRWIKKGEIRSAKLYGDNWMIPNITDKPKHKFKNVSYYWSEKIEISNDDFLFLSRCSNIYIYQDNKNIEIYNVILRNDNNEYIEEITLTNVLREKLEYFLISLPEVRYITVDESIKFIPLKKEIQNWIQDTDELVSSSENVNGIKEGTMLEYGAVIITKGKYKGRIGYFDNESDFNNKGVVYWGDVLLCRDHYELITYKYLSNNITTLEMLSRIKKLNSEVAKLRIERRNYYLCTQLLSELLFVTDLLTDRYINIKYLKKEGNMKVFISHASNDLEFARCLATDIMEKGYDVFLDDWSIDLGENIINKINEGLEDSQILIPIISKDFLMSVFCLDEWTSFYMRFAKIRKSSILPLIIDNSSIPPIMSAIKYFRAKDGQSYQRFLLQLINVLKKHEI